MDNRLVFLYKLSLPDLPGKFRRRAGISCQYHQAADHPVQPVYCPDIRRRIPQRFPNQIRQTSGLIGRKHPGRFNAHHNIRIYIDKFHSTLPFVFLILSNKPLHCKRKEANL